MKRKSDTLLVSVFAVFLGGLMLINLLVPDRVFSERENRYLAKRPDWNLNNVISGRFSRQFEDYITDEFALRDRWVLVKTDIERMLLRTSNNGIYFGSGGHLFENYRRPGLNLSRNIEQINRFAQQFPDIPIHVLLAPNSVAIYPEKMPPFATVFDQLQVLEQVREALSDGVRYVSVYEALARHRDEYIYFRTDHHWTMRGAYYAYVELASALGFVPLSEEEFETEYVTDEFWGTYFSRANNRYLKSDRIEIFRPLNPADLWVKFNDQSGIYESMFFYHHLENRDKYPVFLDGNHPLTTISTGIENGRRLAVFKDSYAHALLPFLANHYQEIHVIDLRFFSEDLTEYLSEHAIDEVLFLYNVSGFSRDNHTVRLR